MTEKKNFKKRKGNFKNYKKDAPTYGDDVQGGMNDWQWYADDANLLKDATNLSFNNAVGGYLPDETFGLSVTEGSTTLGPGWNANNLTIPGVLSMIYVPTVGVSKDFNSPINVAKSKLYTFVRHANSGHANYDSPDLMQYVMAKTSADVLFWHFARAYALCFKYHQTNRYLPKALVQAMGINADDIVANLADFRAMLNIAAVKLNALFIPNTFGYYKRQSWLATNVFLDSQSPKAQLYLPIPYCAWKYNESGSDVGNLTPVVAYDPVGGLLTYSQIKNILDNLINPMVSSEDINIMSGDMLKAYGEDKRVVLPTLPETYSIEFTYSEEVLEQIHNTTFVGEFFDGYTPKIIQNASTGLLEFDPLINADNYITTASGNVIISEGTTGNSSLPFIESRKRFDLITNDATPERIIVASRNTAMYDPLSRTPVSSPSHVQSCGSELFLFGDLYVNSCTATAAGVINDNSKGLARYRVHYINGREVKSRESIMSAVINAMSKFDWFPICYFFYGIVNPNIGEVLPALLLDINDINNYTVLEKNNLSKLHELALLTELDVTHR